MKNETQKKAWQIPQLQILIRSRPEETVLVNCKDQANTIHGPYDNELRTCYYDVKGWSCANLADS